MTALMSATNFPTKISASFALAANPKEAAPEKATAVEENTNCLRLIKYLLIELLIRVRVHFGNFWIKAKATPLKVC